MTIKCGKPLNPVNWQTARVGDRYEERIFLEWLRGDAE